MRIWLLKDRMLIQFVVIIFILEGMLANKALSLESGQKTTRRPCIIVIFVQGMENKSITQY